MVTLSPLLDQYRLQVTTFHFDMNHVQKELIPWGPNISYLELCWNPLHAKAVGSNILPNIVISAHDVAGMFHVLVAVAMAIALLLSKYIGVAGMDAFSTFSNSQSSIFRWLPVIKAIQPPVIFHISRWKCYWVGKIWTAIDNATNISYYKAACAAFVPGGVRKSIN